MVKRIAVFGSTGSVGQQALQVADHLGYRVVGLAAGRNKALLLEQMAKYQPEWAVLADDRQIDPASHDGISYGTEALSYYGRYHGADLVVAAISGMAGFLPTWQAVLSGATVALANKEALVVGGEMIITAAADSGATLLPLDSEHSAIWQCLSGIKPQHVAKLILTASGGPFRLWPSERLKLVTLADALAHPTWSMGNKITVDSATLMNKGLEIIEAHHLFQMPYDAIDVVVHPESIVHSMVELVDGAVLAQLSPPDMRLPIEVALAHPERSSTPWPRLCWENTMELTFSAPRKDDFPCLDLAIEAGKKGKGYPIALNAADEVAVNAFCEGKLEFMDIPRLISQVLDSHSALAVIDVETALAVDREARQRALEYISQY